MKKSSSDKQTLPPLFPSQAHAQQQSDIKMSIGPAPQLAHQHQHHQQQQHQQAQELHGHQTTEHFMNVSGVPQSHSPHLPSASNLNRHMTSA